MTERQISVLKWFHSAPGHTRFREEVQKDRHPYWTLSIQALERAKLLERFNNGKRTEFWRMTDEAMELLAAIARGN